jgi:hypothetical protein
MARAAYGLSFETFSPVERSDHLRADVALFAGFVAPRAAGAAADPAREARLREWLRLYGFGADADRLEREGRSVATLAQVPVPVESWGAFERLYAWDRRPVAERLFAATYLGSALRAFFAQGGRKAYVVRAGDPWSKADDLAKGPAEREADRRERLDALVPGLLPGHAPPSPTARETWRGIAHLFGLDDVSFVLAPDLPDVLDARGRLAPVVPPTEEIEEVFVECSDEIAGAPAPDTLLGRVPPPACDDAALREWAGAVSVAVAFLRRHRPEAQFVAALPLLLEGGRGPGVSAQNPLARLYEERLLRVEQSSLGLTHPAFEPLTSAFLQLATPWLKTLGSSQSPGEVEPPDGALAGLLARNALARGTFRSAAGAALPYAFDLLPDYARSTLLAPVDARAPGGREPLNLLQRACVIGRSPAGIRLLSDVSTSADESYRSAGASRLVGALLRALRAFGEDLAFGASNEASWALAREHVRSLLLELWEAGALRGANPDEAFQVRCDRSTMTQADLDAGRVVVHAQLEVAVAVESIRVVLALSEGGRVALLSGEGAP